MKWVSFLDAPFVFTFFALRWKLFGKLSVHFSEFSRDGVASPEQLRIRDRLKQSPAYNLKAFLGTCRRPRRLNAREDVSDSFECRLAPLTTNLGIRRRDTSHY